MRPLFCLLVASFAVGCNSSAVGGPGRPGRAPIDPDPGVVLPGVSATPAPTATPPEPMSYPAPCSDLFDPETLGAYKLEMPADVEQTLRDEAVNHIENEHPATLHYGAETVPVSVRNRGNKFGCGTKLQLAISFDSVDPSARFHGVKRVDTDSGHCNILTERIALEFARDLGIPAQCANHVKLYVNGKYEGLLTNLEHVNKDWLKRNFGPDGNDGTIWKDGTEPKTNEAAPNWDRQTRFWRSADSTSGNLSWLEANGDIDEWVHEWALEAVMPASDNFWPAGWNYTLYDDTTHGFRFYPRDWDKASPWSSEWVIYDPLDSVNQPPAVLVLRDPTWRARYIAALKDVVAHYDPDHFDERIDAIWYQVRDAAAQDPTLGVTPTTKPPQYVKDQFRRRAEFLRNRMDSL